MLKFLQYFLNNYNSYKMSPQYDEEGNYIDPKVGKLKDDELLIPASKALILHSKSAEEALLKERRRVFHMIHREIKAGRTHVRLETYQTKAATLEYLAEQGYTIETITPPVGGGRGVFASAAFIGDDDEESQGDGTYRYYKVSWGLPESDNTTNANAVVTGIDVGSGTVTIVGQG